MLRSDLIGPATCNRCVQHHRSTGASGADAYWAAWSLGIQQTSFVRTTLRRRPLHRRDDSLPAGPDTASRVSRALRTLDSTIGSRYICLRPVLGTQETRSARTGSSLRWSVQRGSHVQAGQSLNTSV